MLREKPPPVLQKDRAGQPPENEWKVVQRKGKGSDRRTEKEANVSSSSTRKWIEKKNVSQTPVVRGIQRSSNQVPKQRKPWNESKSTWKNRPQEWSQTPCPHCYGWTSWGAQKEGSTAERWRMRSTKYACQDRGSWRCSSGDWSRCYACSDAHMDPYHNFLTCERWKRSRIYYKVSVRGGVSGRNLQGTTL